MTIARPVTDGDYHRLLSVRTRLRSFERWSAERSAEFGLTASQHQLLLAVRGHDETAGPTISHVADYLLIRHNSAVELIDRTQELGLLTRERDPIDHRVVRLKLTPEGLRMLKALSGAHLEELARLTPMIEAVLRSLHPPH